MLTANDEAAPSTGGCRSATATERVEKTPHRPLDNTYETHPTETQREMKRIAAASSINYLDIMLVVSIVATVIGATIPVFLQTTPKTGLEITAEMISSNLRLARQKAIAGNTRYRIHCQYDRRILKVYREESPGTWVLDPPENRFELPADVLVSSTSTPTDGVIIIDGHGAIRAGDSSVVLRLIDRSNNRLTIRISENGMVQESPNW